MEEKKRCVVLLSGGMDSLTTLAIALREGFEPFLLHLNYGQKTEEAELKAFKRIADFYGIKEERRLICHTNFFTVLGGSALVDKDLEIPEGDINRIGVPITYVPFRNGLLLSLAISYAEKVKAQAIFFGAISVDNSGYPDCNEEFVKKFEECAKSGSVNLKDLKIYTPLMNLRKKEILQVATALGAPLHYSWSCYKNNDLACGRCDSCLLRLKAFEEIGAVDPIPYVRYAQGGERIKLEKLIRLKRLLEALTVRT